MAANRLGLSDRLVVNLEYWEPDPPSASTAQRKDIRLDLVFVDVNMPKKGKVSVGASCTCPPIRNIICQTGPSPTTQLLTVISSPPIRRIP